MKQKIVGLIQATLIVLSLVVFVGCGPATLSDVEKSKADKDVGKLIEFVNKKELSAVVQNAAIIALGELKAKEAVPTLEHQLTATDYDRVRIAATALVAIGDETAQKALTKVINYKDARIETIAMEGLGGLKSTVAIPVLIKKMDGIDSKGAATAAKALGEIGGEKAVSALVEKLKTPVVSVRISCLKALQTIGGEEAIKGIATLLGDKNETVRDRAIGVLISSGEYKPFALAALRSDNINKQKSALMIFKSTHTKPSEPEDKVWFEVAQIAMDIEAHPNMKVDKATVNALAKKGRVGAQVYFQLLKHKSPVMREYAIRTLEKMGASVVPVAEKSVSKYAKDVAKKWYAKRSAWAGAPSWKLDLWGAITALNPEFQPIEGDDGNSVVFGAISSTKYAVRREFIPYLILIVADSKARQEKLFGSFTISKRKMKAFKEKAIKRIVSAKKESLLPLLAGLEDEDLAVANACARLLGKIGDRSVIPQIAEALTRNINNGVSDLTHSGLYNVLQQFNDPSTERILKKVRPNKMRVTKMFKKRFPGYTVVNVRVKNLGGDDKTKPVVFKIRYYKDDKNLGELKIRFVKNKEEDWVPNPPFPKFIKENK